MRLIDADAEIKKIEEEIQHTEKIIEQWRSRKIPSKHEFVRACDELKTELEKTRMYKMITRLLDWLAEKIE